MEHIMADGTLMMSPVETEHTPASQRAIGAQGPALPSKSFLQLLNICIGFLGIQFGWAIQMGQMGPLLESLGSNARLIGFISWAGPVTGVLVQPIVGALSDGSQSRFGRRRPFLLIGALLTATSLILMPNSPNLLVAAVLLWILDASLNISQGPYRALVPDVVPRAQHATTYSLMSLTIGLGSVAAFLIGFIIPSMHTLFYLGAFAMLAAMIWTIVTTPEPAPKAAVKAKSSGNILTTLTGFFAETFRSIAAMPFEAKKLCLAHSFTWFGLGCLFFFFSVFVPHQVFGATDPHSPLYQKGVQWASLCYAVMNAVCFVASALITRLCQQGISKKLIHTIGLLCMGMSLVSMFSMSTPAQIMVAMGVLGIGWATTLSIPFALLSEHVPPGKEGVLMGTFNVFIAAPQVVTSLVVGSVIMAAGENYAVAMVIGGIAMGISALLLQWVKESKMQDAPLPTAV